MSRNHHSSLDARSLLAGVFGLAFFPYDSAFRLRVGFHACYCPTAASKGGKYSTEPLVVKQCMGKEAGKELKRCPLFNLAVGHTDLVETMAILHRDKPITACWQRSLW